MSSLVRLQDEWVQWEKTKGTYKAASPHEFQVFRQLLCVLRLGDFHFGCLVVGSSKQSESGKTVESRQVCTHIKRTEVMLSHGLGGQVGPSFDNNVGSHVGCSASVIQRRLDNMVNGRCCKVIPPLAKVCVCGYLIKHTCMTRIRILGRPPEMNPTQSVHRPAAAIYRGYHGFSHAVSPFIIHSFILGM